MSLPAMPEGSHAGSLIIKCQIKRSYHYFKVFDFYSDLARNTLGGLSKKKVTYSNVCCKKFYLAELRDYMVVGEKGEIWDSF